MKSQPRTKAEDNETVLDELERVVRWSEEFTLAFVKCNHAPQCDAMRKAILDRVQDKSVLEVEFDGPIVSLLDEIRKRWTEKNAPDAVCVLGLEKSMNEQRGTSRILGSLNHERELLRRLIPGALMIWLPDFALDLIARSAPDFWAWRSGVYEFPTHADLWQSDSNAASLDDATLLSLSTDEKRKEITRVVALLRSARALSQQDARTQASIVRLLNKLGILHYSLGELAAAQKYYEQSLPLSRQLRQAEDEAISLHRLGMIAQDRGENEEARRYYEASLRIENDLSNESGIAATQHQLGTLAHDQRDLNEARRLYDKSLEIERRLGNSSGIAASLHQLGTVALQQGELEQARQLYEQSLEIERKIGDQNGTATTLHQLGRVSRQKGDFTMARRYLSESLEIKNKIGNRYGIAVTLNELGLLADAEGKPIEAVQLFQQALQIFEMLKSPRANVARDNLQIVQSKVKT